MRGESLQDVTGRFTVARGCSSDRARADNRLREPVSALRPGPPTRLPASFSCAPRTRELTPRLSFRRARARNAWILARILRDGDPAQTAAIVWSHFHGLVFVGLAGQLTRAGTRCRIFPALLRVAPSAVLEFQLFAGWRERVEQIVTSTETFFDSACDAPRPSRVRAGSRLPAFREERASRNAAGRVAAEELWRHAEWLRRFARGLVGEADADEMVQETLASALRHAPDDGECLARGWRRSCATSRICASAALPAARAAKNAPCRRRRSRRPKIFWWGESRQQLMRLLHALPEPSRVTLLALCARLARSRSPSACAWRRAPCAGGSKRRWRCSRRHGWGANDRRGRFRRRTRARPRASR